MSLSSLLDVIWNMFAYSLVFIIFMFCIAAVIGCFKGLINLFIGEDEPEAPEHKSQVTNDHPSVSNRRVRLVDNADAKNELSKVESDGLKSTSTNNNE